MTSSLNERTKKKEGTLKERISGVIAPLLAERDQLVAERADLREQVMNIDADLVQLDRVMKAAGYEANGDRKPKSSPQKPATQKPARVKKIASTNESLRKVVQYVIDQNDPVTGIEVADAVGLGRGHVGSYLREARARGWIRQAGARRSPKGGREMYLYASLPDSVERMEEALNNGQ